MGKVSENPIGPLIYGSTQLHVASSPKYTGKIPGCVLSLRTCILYIPHQQTTSEILAGGHFVMAVIVT